MIVPGNFGSMFGSSWVVQVKIFNSANYWQYFKPHIVDKSFHYWTNIPLLLSMMPLIFVQKGPLEVYN